MMSRYFEARTPSSKWVAPVGLQLVVYKKQAVKRQTGLNIALAVALRHARRWVPGMSEAGRS